MSEVINSKSKYLEVSEQLRQRLVEIYCKTKEHGALAKACAVPSAEDIQYNTVVQEIKMIALRTEEARRSIQAQLVSLEKTKEYIRVLETWPKESTKEEVAAILKEEIASAESKVAEVEGRMKLAFNLDPAPENNILHLIQRSIDSLTEQMERK